MAEKAHSVERPSLDRAMELALELKAQGREEDALLIARMVVILEERNMPMTIRKAIKRLEELPEDPEEEKRFLKDLQEGRFHEL